MVEPLNLTFSIKKTRKKKLKRWLILQRTQVQCLALTWWLTTVSSSSRVSDTLGARVGSAVKIAYYCLLKRQRQTDLNSKPARSTAKDPGSVPNS